MLEVHREELGMNVVSDIDSVIPGCQPVTQRTVEVLMYEMCR